MLHLETEHGRQDEQLEPDSCRARLLTLQAEFRKMEEMVTNMIRYKAKIDQLKQENANVTLSYEANLQKYYSHISVLERDNILLRNQTKKMEAQIHGKGDDKDKGLLLLDRLKTVETENSSLVLENEQQRQQYEKCLDEIANQVVQALLAQKTLREECLKLQSRVQDLETQNKHLIIMFQQKMKFSADTLLQQQASCITESQVQQTSSTIDISEGDKPLSQREITGKSVDNTTGLLQMIYSENQLQDSSPRNTQCCTPLLWLQDDTRPIPSSSIASSNISAPITRQTSTASPCLVQAQLRAEFAATSSYPKVKQTKRNGRRARSLEHEMPAASNWERTSDCCRSNMRKAHSHETRYVHTPRLKHCLSADDITHYKPGNKVSAQTRLLVQHFQWSNSLSQNAESPSNIFQPSNVVDKPVVFFAGGQLKHKTCRTFSKDCEDRFIENFTESTSISALRAVEPISLALTQYSSIKSGTSVHNSLAVSSVLRDVAKQNKIIQCQALRNLYEPSIKPSVSPSSLQGQIYYYDYSDEDSDTRPVYPDISVEAAVSINELLDSRIDRPDEPFYNSSLMHISTHTTNDCKIDAVVPRNVSESKISTATLDLSQSGPLSEKTCIPMPNKISSLKKSTYKQMKACKNPAANHKIASAFKEPGEVLNKNLYIAQKKKEVQSPDILPFSNQEQTRILERNAYDKQYHSNDNPEVRGKGKLENFPPSASPNLCQKSQDIGLVSSSTHSPAIDSTSKSSSHQNHNISHSNSGLKRRVINRETTTGSSIISLHEDSEGQCQKLIRPGQLILAPEEKNFNFQGFSSANSTSSEETSPLKIFETKQNCDMRSSVIEVKKDGTFVHTMRSIGDSSSASSNSLSVSPSSPVKSPTKIPAFAANRAARITQPETRIAQIVGKENNCKDKSKNVPRPESTNITVGFLFNNHLFPGNSHFGEIKNGKRNSITEAKSKIPPGQSQDFGNHIHSKCQSSDSSFENLRVERSGSKDDGYSTMSSDIHPEVLEKFSDTLTRKLSEAHLVAPISGVKNLVTEMYVHQSEVRRSLDATLHVQDRSFDLTSDPDSALETSVHSNAEMATSSSSQVSTSSSDFPLSPCSTNVSKIVRPFGGDISKIHFVRGGESNIPCRDKDSSTSSSTKTLSSSLSPVSAKTFVPSCYQPPESPRRLANEFQNPNTFMSQGNSATFRKLSPGSPKHLNKSFGGFSLKQKEQTSGIPVVSLRKTSLDTKLQNVAKPQFTSATLPNRNNCHPKGLYSSADQGAKNKTLSLPKGHAGKTTDQAVVVTPDTVFADLISDTSSQVKHNCENKLKHPSAQKVTHEIRSSIKSIDRDKRLAGKNLEGNYKSVKSTRQTQPKNYATSTSNTDATLPKSGVQVNKTKVVNNGASTQNAISVCKPDKLALSSDTCKVSKSASSNICASGSKSIKHKHNIISVQGALKDVSSSPKESDSISSIKNHAPLRPSNLTPKIAAQKCPNSSSQPTLSSSSVSNDIPNTHSYTTSSPPLWVQTEDSALTSTAIGQPLKENLRIVKTNHRFQQVSDSENNEDDDSRPLSPVPVDGTIKDAQLKDDLNNCNIQNNIKHVKCIVPTSNSPTTNWQAQASTPKSVISERGSITYCEIKDFTNSRMLQSSDIAHINQSSSASMQPSHQHHHYCPIDSTQTVNQNIKLKTCNNIQCLSRSWSENDLCMERKTTSIYERSFCLSWDSSVVLERSASAVEIAFLTRRSWPFVQGQIWRAASNEINCLHLHRARHRRIRQCIFPTSSSSSTLFSSSHSHPLRHQHQHYHQPKQYPQNDKCCQQRNAPLTLQLQRSNISEVDDNRPKLATTNNDSLSSCHIGLTSDESPRTDVDEQKGFHSQFYSLCAVDSNRSLLSSGNESKEKLYPNNFNEGINYKGFDKDIENSDTLNSTVVEYSVGYRTGNNEIAAAEFEEIARQIASLSKTVDELNLSLSSLNSGEFQHPSCLHIGLSQCHAQQCTGRRDVTDGYHWVDDESLFNSSHAECIIGRVNLECDESVADGCTHECSFDHENTEDASSEFCQFAPRKQNKTVMCRNSAGQDEIFAQTLFDTVKEKRHSKGMQQQVIPSGGSNEDAIDVPGDVAVFRKIVQHDYAEQEEGDNDVGGVKAEESRPGQVCEEEGSEMTDKLASSNNESDDSLASDIGLDRMMCQRLFGRKGSFESSSNQNDASIDAAKFFKICEEVPDRQYVPAFDLPSNFPDTDEEVPVYEICKLSVPLFMLPRDSYHRETRDVGIDAMSQSQNSLNASFETVDQSLAELDKTDIKSETLTRASDQHSSFTIAQMSCHQKFDPNTDIEHGGETDVASASDIITQGSTALQESRLQPHSLKGQIEQNKTDDTCHFTSYSDFVADLNHTSAGNKAAIAATPPKLPPRQPIIANTRHQPNFEREIAPLPPPPACLDKERYRPSYNQHQHSQHHRQRPEQHLLYVNHIIPSIAKSESIHFGKKDCPRAHVYPECKLMSAPPPLPPRLPQGSNSQDISSRKNIPSRRTHSTNRSLDVRPQSFNNYLFNKSTAALPSLSPSSSLATYPGPRTHSEKHHHLKMSSSMEKPKDEMSTSKIPRRRLRTRRDRSKSKLNTERQSAEAAAKCPPTKVDSTSKHWRDIDVVNGQALSNTSCDDTSS